MSTTNPTTGANGQPAAGTSGTQLSNNNATQLSSNQFLDLMMTELENQDPLSPSSSDPTQYLTQLAQLTSVEQETDTAQNTQESATEQAVSQAVNLIGQTVTYVDQTSGDNVTGTVNSVQITSSGPTLTIDGTAGIDPAYVTAVAPTDSGSGSSGGTDGSGDGSGSGDGTDGGNAVAPGADTKLPSTGGTSGGSQSGGSGNSGTNPYAF